MFVNCSNSDDSRNFKNKFNSHPHSRVIRKHRCNSLRCLLDRPCGPSVAYFYQFYLLGANLAIRQISRRMKNIRQSYRGIENRRCKSLRWLEFPSWCTRPYRRFGPWGEYSWPRNCTCRCLHHKKLPKYQKKKPIRPKFLTVVKLFAKIIYNFKRLQIF